MIVLRSRSLLLLDSEKFAFDMTSISQQGSFEKTVKSCGIHFCVRCGHTSEAAFHFVWESYKSSFNKYANLQPGATRAILIHFFFLIRAILK